MNVDIYKGEFGPSTVLRDDATCAAAFNHYQEWVRLPRVGERSPLCGLSRSSLNELILPCPANGGRPPVRSIVLKKRGAIRGIRLIHAPSLLDYLNRLACEAAEADRQLEEANVPASGVTGGAS